MKDILAVSAFIAVVATFVSTAPARDAYPSIPNPLDYPLPEREPPKNIPPYIIIDRTNRTRATNATNGLAKSAIPCRSITFTWWSLKFNGKPADEQWHSAVLQVSGSKEPFTDEFTNQKLGNRNNNYFQRQWSIFQTYFFEHNNIGPGQPSEITFVTNGIGYKYSDPNKRFNRTVYSEYFENYGTSTNSLYYDCISWPN
ncbi:MAG: hypothetical protein JOS17DRAFT_804589 [Linnemannia elongata]|nr:MAG: hypothetical protein JOS17DRAFT_804589 [Linnemannia elongata]